LKVRAENGASGARVAFGLDGAGELAQTLAIALILHHD
jgi:hypothetical protein